jgi:hypothetical protein
MSLSHTPNKNAFSHLVDGKCHTDTADILAFTSGYDGIFQRLVLCGRYEASVLIAERLEHLLGNGLIRLFHG